MTGTYWEEARALLVRPSPAGIRQLCATLEGVRAEWEAKPEAKGEGWGEYGRLKGLFEAARRFHGEWGRLAVSGVRYGPAGEEQEAAGSPTVDIAG